MAKSRPQKRRTPTMATRQSARRLDDTRPGDQRGALKPWGEIKTRGDSRTLLCDFDDPRPPTLARLWRVLGRIGVRPIYIAYDRSHSGCWHVRVRLNIALTSGEIVAAQALLGSDPQRERYNLMRVIAGARIRDWNLLFQRKFS